VCVWRECFRPENVGLQRQLICVVFAQTNRRGTRSTMVHLVVSSGSNFSAGFPPRNSPPPKSRSVPEWCVFAQTVHMNRIYCLHIYCSEEYPEKPPKVRFTSRINMGCVNQSTGEVRQNTHVLRLGRLPDLLHAGFLGSAFTIISKPFLGVSTADCKHTANSFLSKDAASKSHSCLDWVTFPTPTPRAFRLGKCWHSARRSLV
jgi:hypothetical protein